MKQVCQHCNGTGYRPDYTELGNTMRKLRQRAKLTLRETARRMDISAAYLSDMELGRRAWSADRISQVKEVCK